LYDNEKKNEKEMAKIRMEVDIDFGENIQH
jgi:hypothetical protein